jgi:hypothetical protein
LEAVKHTAEWYRRYYQTAKPEPLLIRELTQHQILSYAEALNYKPSDLGTTQKSEVALDIGLNDKHEPVLT